MEDRYLLDTNTVSYIFKGNFPAVRRRVAEIPFTQLAISTVTEGELRFGIARQPAATRLHAAIEDFLLRVSILPWDSASAQHYGHLRAALERDGHPMGNLDTMIAAHALATGAILVTNDRAFARVKKLKVEDWTKRPHH
jgi:tRNA(fMet)-specific endonuclease VapC